MAKANRGARFYQGSASDINLSKSPNYGIGGPSGGREAVQKKGITPEEIEETHARIKEARKKKARKGKKKAAEKIRKVNRLFDRGVISKEERDEKIAFIQEHQRQMDLKYKIDD